MSNFVGSPYATLVRQETGQDKQSGKFVQSVWEGTEDGINGLEAAVASVCDSYLKSPMGGGKWTITARFGAFTLEGVEETPTSEERLRFNVVQKSIFTNPELTGGLTAYQIQVVRKYVDDRLPVPESASFLPAQTELYELAMAGVDSYPVYQPVVTVTDTASALYPWTIGFANYGYTYSTAAMIQDAELTSGWAANLPSETSSLTGFTYGWLKKPPEIVTVAGNKTQLVQEYEYGLWADALLPSA